MLYFASTGSNMWLFAICGIGFLWIAAAESRAGVAVMSGFLTGVSYFYLAFDWAQVATNALLPRIALSVVEAAFYGALALIWNYLWRGWRTHQASLRSKRPSQTPRIAWIARSASMLTPLSALAWAAMEQARSSIPFGGLPWGNVAFSLVDSPLISLASVGSTQLVCAIAVAAAICFGLAVNHLIHIRISTSAASAIAGIALIMVPIGIPTGTAYSPVKMRIAVVQGNVPEAYGGFGGSFAQRSLAVTQNHIDASSAILGDEPDLIVWPESASDLDFRHDADARALVRSFVERAGVPLLLGTQRYFDGVRTNDYVFVTPASVQKIGDDASGVVLPTYSKQHPVPFGEYAPFREFFASFMPIINQIGIDMVPGTNPAQLQIEDAAGNSIVVATPICFEVAYDSIVAEGALGADMIIVPTSNYTFGYSAEASQQFAMSRFRAVEHGKTVVQVSTAGISGVISPNGVTQYRSGLFEQDAHTATIALNHTQTFATRTYKERPIAVYAIGAFSVVFALGSYTYVRTHAPRSAQAHRAARR